MSQPVPEDPLTLMAQSALGAIGRAKPPLDACDNSKAFVDHYGLRFEGELFDWYLWRHLVPMYLDDHVDQAFMAGAQTGKSLRLMVGLLRFGVLRWGKGLGYYFPDFFLPLKFSRERFGPFMHSAPELSYWVGRLDRRKGKGTDQVITRNLGDTTFNFLSAMGKTATEGSPMTATFFDEVRGMSPRQIERIKERSSAEGNPITWYCSTALYPESDIHKLFLEGDQRWFHSDCKCSDGARLAEQFPDCVLDLSGVSKKVRAQVDRAFEKGGLPPLGIVRVGGMSDEEAKRWPPAVYCCTKCHEFIVDPRDGWWEADNPTAFRHSWQLPQMCSPMWAASRMLDKIRKSKDRQELYNSGAGLPFLDPESTPVTLDVLRRCVNEQAYWALTMSPAWRAKHLVNSALGLDQQGGYNVVVIKAVQPNGKFRTIHLEVIQADDPWRRVDQLMTLFDVRVAVVDGMPNYNEAHRFAKRHRGKAFLASYGGDGDTVKMVVWNDKRREASQSKGREAGLKHSVTIHRTKAHKWSLGRWQKGLNETPDPDRLIQRLPRQDGRVVFTPHLAQGNREPTAICREAYWFHLTRVTFREKELSEEQRLEGRRKIVMQHVGVDPHFAHADLYCTVAAARVANPNQKVIE